MALCRRKLIFHHIPKSAGTSLRGWLWDSFGRANVFWHGEDALLEEVIAEHGPEYFERYSVIGGHIPYFHPDICRIPGSFVHAAVLRQPEEQLVSHFEYVSHRKNHALHSGLSLEQTLEDPNTPFYLEAANIQCRWATGKDLYADALSVMERGLFIVGCLDYIDTFVAEVAKQFNVPLSFLGKVNAQESGYFNRHYSPRVAYLIDSISREDKLLYNDIYRRKLLITNNI